MCSVFRKKSRHLQIRFDKTQAETFLERFGKLLTNYSNF